jgi:hypothetical protein
LARIDGKVGGQPAITLVLLYDVDLERGDLEGIVLKDRESTYRDGSRAGWFKVKDAGWCAREAWRFQRSSRR